MNAVATDTTKAPKTSKDWDMAAIAPFVFRSIRRCAP